jgi:hypothetical protein
MVESHEEPWTYYRKQEVFEIIDGMSMRQAQMRRDN